MPTRKRGIVVPTRVMSVVEIDVTPEEYEMVTVGRVVLSRDA
jgi:hypothetical protein